MNLVGSRIYFFFCRPDIGKSLVTMNKEACFHLGAFRPYRSRWAQDLFLPTRIDRFTYFSHVVSPCRMRFFLSVSDRYLALVTLLFFHYNFWGLSCALKETSLAFSLHSGRTKTSSLLSLGSSYTAASGMILVENGDGLIAWKFWRLRALWCQDLAGTGGSNCLARR